MTRVPSVPYKVVVKMRRADNGAALPDQNKNCATLAGAIEYRTEALKRRGVFKVETWLCIDETTPHAEQTEPLRETQVSRGSNDRIHVKEVRRK